MQDTQHSQTSINNHTQISHILNENNKLQIITNKFLENFKKLNTTQ